MAENCKKKPNRTKRRYFTECDVSRIAQNCVDDTGTTPEELLACIAKHFGFTHISMSRVPTVVESGLSLRKGQIDLMKKSLNLLKTSIEKVANNRWVRNKPWLRNFILRWGPVLADIIDALDDLLDDSPPQRKVEDVLKCQCKGLENGDKKS